ncbi:hypothetical protein [Peribacillus frigoritolerans]|uniref:hypothetical protein n=1 Tax=Peribacillus frigoritolerans TaxID=450367 RepID=UPI002E9D074B|nr:hypothetical protein [Peribacillus frigoritolerans]
MVDYSYEKQHLKKLRTFIYITIALIFSMIFIFISIFLLYFSIRVKKQAVVKTVFSYGTKMGWTYGTIGAG